MSKSLKVINDELDKSISVNNLSVEELYIRYWRDSNGKRVFDHVQLGKDLWKKHSLLWHAHDLYYYNNGVYVKGGFEKLSYEIQNILGHESSKTRKAEVMDWIATKAKYSSIEINDDINIINLKNGLFNIKTGEFVEHTPEHYSTIQIPVEYNPKAQCPTIIDFFKSVVPEDSLRFVFEWFGYSLYREYKLEKVLMLFGTGGNGKSIFISLYNKFLGRNNISAVDLHSLENDRFAPSMLLNKLANTFADVDSRYLESSNMLKALSGNDIVNAQFKNKMPFEFRNYAKLTFSANKLPGFKDTSDGNLDRWMVLPFPNRFRGTNKQDINLAEKLTSTEELSGLLNYALKYLKALLKNGRFTIGASMQAEIDNWQNKTDTVVMFIDDMCVLDPEMETNKKALYADYREWCREGGFFPLKITNFYERMEHHGFKPKQSSKQSNYRKWVFKGIHIPTEKIFWED